MKRSTFIGSLFGLFTLPVLAVKGLKPKDKWEVECDELIPTCESWRTAYVPTGKYTFAMIGYVKDIELKDGTILKDVPDGSTLPIDIDLF